MDKNAKVGRVREEKRKGKKKNAGARNSREVGQHCVCPMLCGSGGSKNRLAKVAGACSLRDEKLHALVARSRF